MGIQSKNEDVGNYNKKYEKFFEEFYIVGVDKMALGCLGKQFEVVRPKLLYNYPNNKEHSEKHNIIKDFCFSTGVPVQELDLSTPDLDTKINQASNFTKPSARKLR